MQLRNRQRSFWKDNGLSIALITLFLLSLGAQIATGYVSFDDELARHGRPAIGLTHYLGTGTFLDGAFSNLQAAFLQLAVLITLSAVLKQRGAAHSRKPEDEERTPRSDADAASAARDEGGSSSQSADGPRMPGILHRSSAHGGNWLYRHSLSLAFIGLFLGFLTLHIVFGAARENEHAALSGGPRAGVLGYVVSARFWFSCFQTWQAEFLAIAAYVLLSIVLRQERSSESKPDNAPDEETGVTNE